MTAYYNEIDPYAAQWLRNLISAGRIAPGDVDTRSILEVKPDDIKEYSQCHFFAGIGGWGIALRLAGWPDEVPVWTGSCPCQPFSVAGKQKAQQDERHLWPAWFKLIAEVKPPTIFGEQVAGALAHGWWDDAADDLEREGYETGAAVLPACSVGAPHKRDRLWFVANAGFRRFSEQRERQIQQPGRTEAECGSEVVADPNNKRSQRRNGAELPECSGEQPAWQSDTPLAHSASGSEQSSSAQCNERRFQETLLRESGHYDHWNAEPAVGRVANGVPARSHKLRAYGNAIVPQVAAEFIKIFIEGGYHK